MQKLYPVVQDKKNIQTNGVQVNGVQTNGVHTNGVHANGVAKMVNGEAH